MRYPEISFRCSTGCLLHSDSRIHFWALLIQTLLSLGFSSGAKLYFRDACTPPARLSGASPGSPSHTLSLYPQELQPLRDASAQHQISQFHNFVSPKLTASWRLTAPTAPQHAPRLRPLFTITLAGGQWLARANGERLASLSLPRACRALMSWGPRGCLQ